MKLSELKCINQNITVGIECNKKFYTSEVNKVGKYVVGDVFFYSCTNTNDLKFTILYTEC